MLCELFVLGLIGVVIYCKYFATDEQIRHYKNETRQTVDELLRNPRSIAPGKRSAATQQQRHTISSTVTSIRQPIGPTMEPIRGLTPSMVLMERCVSILPKHQDSNNNTTRHRSPRSSAKDAPAFATWAARSVQQRVAQVAKDM